jgi:tungstate transport system substrate-binding protein
VLGLLLTACSLNKKAEEQSWLVIATTQDLSNSGLLERLLPPFEQANKVRVKLLPVSQAKALEYARNGGVDVLLVELSKSETLFKLAGAMPQPLPYQPEFNSNPLTAPTPLPQPKPTPSFDNIMTGRELAFWSDLVLVGPTDDLARVGAQYNASRAFKWIALNNTPFIVAGEAPGLVEAQNRIWGLIGRNNENDRGTGYRVVAGDAQSALKEAEAQGAYLVIPRYVYLNNAPSGKLKVILQNDPILYLGYELSIPNTIRIPDRDVSLARAFVYYLASNSSQATISEFRKDNASDYLFRPYSYRVYFPQ